jgi:hypothetical protein
MKGCWIELLKVYNVIERAYKEGLIDDYARICLEAEMDALDFMALGNPLKEGDKE